MENVQLQSGLPTLVLKDGESFAVFGAGGDVSRVGRGEQGLYHQGTRFLSRLELFLDGERPSSLGTRLRDDNLLLETDFANPRRTLHLLRSVVLREGVCHLRLRIRSYAAQALPVRIEIAFEADFADLFEVGGASRPRRGILEPPVAADGATVIRYQGLDGVERRTRIACSPPARALDGAILYEAEMPPGSEASVSMTISCEIGDDRMPRKTFDEALAEVAGRREALRARLPVVESSNPLFDRWWKRSADDLEMLLTTMPEGVYPYAGVPWYSTAFGRDGILTALEHLWMSPRMARGVLAVLAARQATSTEPERDAEPGKILHETRRGEMAALREVPFGLYYGSIDATPLFVVLAAAYLARSGDRAFLERLWPSVERALDWIEHHGDVDGDGFVEYSRQAANGLVHQGWKDSDDCIFHADGSSAEGPIALGEVQGYVYAAKHGGAVIARALGRLERAEALERDAESLQERFEQAFWCENLGTYALALDGRKRPCRVRASNAGHVLWSGIASAERAARVAETLLGPDLYSGWGIRTLGASEVRYNPMSYHNGSVWPHDNALIAAGLARCGRKEEALRVFTGLFDVSSRVALHRLPELFCGFERRSGEGPTLYPVACAPQAWSVGAVALLLQACLGLSVDAEARRVRFEQPVLPGFLDWLSIRNLEVVAGGSADFSIRREAGGVSIDVTRQDAGIEVVR